MKPVDIIPTMSERVFLWYGRRCLVRINFKVSEDVWMDVIFPLQPVDNGMVSATYQTLKRKTRQ